MTDDYTEVVEEGFRARILDNTATDSLPIYYFSENGISAPHDGLIVLFEIKEKQSWIGKFDRGGKIFSLLLQDQAYIYVWAGSSLYRVPPKNPEKTKAILFSKWFYNEFLLFSPERELVIFFERYSDIVAYDLKGNIRWKTNIDSSDGLVATNFMDEDTLFIRVNAYASQMEITEEYHIDIHSGLIKKQNKVSPYPKTILKNNGEIEVRWEYID